MKIVLFMLCIMVSLSGYAYSAESDDVQRMIDQIKGRSQSGEISNAERINMQIRAFKQTPDYMKAEKFNTLDTDVKQIILSEIQNTLNQKQAYYEECVKNRDLMDGFNAQTNENMNTLNSLGAMGGGPALFLPPMPQMGELLLKCENHNPQNFIPQWLMEIK